MAYFEKQASGNHRTYKYCDYVCWFAPADTETDSDKVTPCLKTLRDILVKRHSSMQPLANLSNAGAPAPDPDCSLNQWIKTPLSTSPRTSAIQEQSTSFRRKKPKTMSMVIQSQSQEESPNGKPKETTNEQHYFNKRREKKESVSVRTATSSPMAAAPSTSPSSQQHRERRNSCVVVPHSSPLGPTSDTMRGPSFNVNINLGLDGNDTITSHATSPTKACEETVPVSPGPEEQDTRATMYNERRIRGSWRRFSPLR